MGRLVHFGARVDGDTTNQVLAFHRLGRYHLGSVKRNYVRLPNGGQEKRSTLAWDKLCLLHLVPVLEAPGNMRTMTSPVGLPSIHFAERRRVVSGKFGASGTSH
jgi:hypothetical protein